MSKNDWLLLLLAVYTTLILLLLFAQWYRKRLIQWAFKEVNLLRRESDEIQRMRKHLIQQFEWADTRAYHGNLVMNAAFEVRVKEYNRRRAQLISVTHKIPKLLPW